MFLTLEVITVFLVAVAMSMALAHALEFPGKQRLNKETYMAVQTIYYPGFTLGGIGEPLAAIATLILLIVMRGRGAAFWWTFAAFIALAAMHAVFWFVTQPTNRFWLKNQEMSKAGSRFFAVDQLNQSASNENGDQDWKRFRDRWEYSHLVRAVLSGIALIAVVVAVAT